MNFWKSRDDRYRRLNDPDGTERRARPQRGRRVRPRRVLRPELLETRTLLNASIEITGDGHLTLETDPAAAQHLQVSVVDGLYYTFQVAPDEPPIDVTDNQWMLPVTGSGTNVVMAEGITSIVVRFNAYYDSILLNSTNIATNIVLQGTWSDVIIGDAADPRGLSAIRGEVVIDKGPGYVMSTNIVIDDSGATVGREYGYDVADPRSHVTGGGASIDLPSQLDILALNVTLKGASTSPGQVNTFKVNGSMAAANKGHAEIDFDGSASRGSNVFQIAMGPVAPDLTSLLVFIGGRGDDRYDIAAAGSPTIVRQGPGASTLNLSNGGSTAGISSYVRVEGRDGPFPDEPRGVFDINVDDSAGAGPDLWTLETLPGGGGGGGAYYARLSGLDGKAGSIVYVADQIGSLSVKAAVGRSNRLDVDFYCGDPLPYGAGAPALRYDGGYDGTAGVVSGIRLLNGTLGLPFPEEYHNAAGPDGGDIYFVHGASNPPLDAVKTLLRYVGLTPDAAVLDLVPTTNYVFNDLADPDAALLVRDGDPSRSAGLQTVEFASRSARPAFPSVRVANKQNVTILGGRDGKERSMIVDYESDAAAAGLQALSLEGGPGSDGVQLLDLPPAASTFVHQYGGDDSALIRLAATEGANPQLAALVDGGGGGRDVLDVDAGGLALTPGNFATGADGVVWISGLPAPLSPVAFTNYERVNVRNLAMQPPEPAAATIRAAAGVPLTDAVAATFTSAATGAKAADFSATIAWGDGTADTPGWILQDAFNPSLFYVLGSHTYALNGSFATSIAVASGGSSLIRDVGGVPVSFRTPATTPGSPSIASGNAEVGPAPLTVSGGLDPGSDSGVSNGDGVTNITRPTFRGTAGEAGLRVLVYATQAGASPILLGSTTADAAGGWRLTAASPLADGAYAITAQAVDDARQAVGGLSTLTPTLVIDTIGPTVSDVGFVRARPRLVVTFRDAGAGLDPSSVSNPAAYAFYTGPSATGRGRSRVIPVAVQSDGTPGGLVASVPLFGPGSFRIVSRSSATGLGVQDRAGNPLDGEFSGRLPSGDGRSGGDFTARFDLVHRAILPTSRAAGRPTTRTAALPERPRLSPTGRSATSTR